MAKRKIKIINQMFGKRFGWADLLLIAGLIPAIYFTYKGITFDVGLLAIYTDFLAKPLAFAITGKLVIQNILNKAKK